MGRPRCSSVERGRGARRHGGRPRVPVAPRSRSSAAERNGGMAAAGAWAAGRGTRVRGEEGRGRVVPRGDPAPRPAGGPRAPAGSRCSFLALSSAFVPSAFPPPRPFSSLLALCSRPAPPRPMPSPPLAAADRPACPQVPAG